MQPCHVPFQILNQCIVPCLVLTVASWWHIGFSGKMDWYSNFFKNFPVCGGPTVKSSLSHVVFYLCVLWFAVFFFFFFFYEPAFKNLEIAYNSYSGISWKISQSGNIASPPHGSSNESRGTTGYPLSNEAHALQHTESVTPRVSGSGAVSKPFIIRLTPLLFLIPMKHSSVPLSLCKVEKQKNTENYIH